MITHDIHVCFCREIIFFKKKKKIEFHLLQILLGALRVNSFFFFFLFQLVRRESSGRSKRTSVSTGSTL